jgi:mannose-6-phosphate isomerase
VDAGRGDGGATLGPLHLTPLLVGKPWGGRGLARFGRVLPGDGPFGESWDVADLPPGASSSVADPVTRVAVGPAAGASLTELIAADREAVLGDSADLDGRFPVLVKLLDAREHLSVQVHPPAAYVAERPGVHLKTESWVVLAADPGAEVMIGLVEGTSLDDLGRVVGTPELATVLRRVPAVVGEVFHLPAGTIHALGAGTMVAEVQTPSDTTFRLYDWTKEYGRELREMHLDQGLRAIELGWEHNVTPWRPPAEDATVVVDTPHYRLSRHRLPAGAELCTPAGRARILQVVSGTLAGEELAWPIGPGGTVVLPAVWAGPLTAEGDCTVLETTV